MTVARTANGRLREILETAAELFDRSGYANVSMDDIGRAVGLAKPSLYHYVKSKDEILYLIHSEFMDVSLRAMQSRRDGRSSEEELRETIRDILVVMQTHRPMVRVFFEHYRDLDSRHRKAIVQQRDRYANYMQTLIRRGITRHEFRPVDPKLVSLAIFGMCNWMYQWYDARGRLPASEIGEIFAEIVLDGLKPRGHATKRTSRRPTRTKSG